MCFCKLSSASTLIAVLSACSITRSIALLTSTLLKVPSILRFSMVTFPLPFIEFWLQDAKSNAVKVTRMNFVIIVIIFIMTNSF